MLKSLMESLNVDRDGAVRRTEFCPPLTRTEVILSPNEREAIESYLYDSTDFRFKYTDRKGHRGVVFYDNRGRAAAAIVRELDDGLLLTLAEKEGYKYVPSAKPHPQVEV